MGLFSKASTLDESAFKSSFKTQFSEEERKNQHKKVIESHPTKIPVIVERASHSSVPEIDKSKYLVPGDLTVAQFIHLIRKRVKLANDQGLFIYIGGQLPASSALFSSIYEEYKDDDGFLYIVYAGESCFGNL